ncbi:hypothetical protein N9Y17_00340 [Gammaproteobacteria bacterium]|nr:hypothetical protein [Gammaproteobacteria bacterium]
MKESEKSTNKEINKFINKYQAMRYFLFLLSISLLLVAGCLLYFTPMTYNICLGLAAGFTTTGLSIMILTCDMNDLNKTIKDEFSKANEIIRQESIQGAQKTVKDLEEANQELTIKLEETEKAFKAAKNAIQQSPNTSSALMTPPRLGTSLLNHLSPSIAERLTQSSMAPST